MLILLKCIGMGIGWAWIMQGCFGENGIFS